MTLSGSSNTTFRHSLKGADILFISPGVVFQNKLKIS